MAHRSTTLKMAARYCNRALDYYDARAPYDRQGFAVGVAAHAVLQDIANHRGEDIRRTAEETVRSLTTLGRAFDGEPEPPMHIDAAIAGRDIALGYLATNTIPLTAKPEIGIAVNRAWKPVPYRSPDAHYRNILDVIDTIESDDEEMGGATGICVTDYKTAWSTDAAELETVQLRGQAATAAAHHPDVSFIRREVINLRTGKSYHADTWLDDEGWASIERWRKDIDLAIEAVEFRGPDGRRPATPGAGCMGCPYLSRCDAAVKHFHAQDFHDDPEEMATVYATTLARAKQLEASLKLVVDEAPIEWPGSRVGWVTKQSRILAPDGHRAVAHAWFDVPSDRAAEWDANNGAVLGLLKALSPGAGGVANVGKVKHPFTRGDDGWKEARAALESAALTTVTERKFEITRVQTIDPGVNENTQQEPA
jgi:hypothetical protein